MLDAACTVAHSLVVHALPHAPGRDLGASPRGIAPQGTPDIHILPLFTVVDPPVLQCFIAAMSTKLTESLIRPDNPPCHLNLAQGS